MEFRMFGGMEVRSAGRSFEVGTPRQQTVLAALVVDARRPVAIETLINRVWDRTPPADPRAVLYSHLSRIRRMPAQPGPLADGTTVRIERRHAGYPLDADPDLVDLHRFRRLSDEGCDRRRADEARAAAFAESLRLWRGSPLAGLPGEWAAQVRESRRQRRLDAKAAIGSALRHYGEVIRSNPDRNAPPLAPAIIQALGRAGVDFSVPRGALRSWLANPVHTPYPAISQTFLLRGWRLRGPVHLDVIVANYESARGVTSPREIAEVRIDVLKAAVVEGSNSRHGTETRDFGQLLAPR